jgi:RND family efflux transporter MFP subunit
MTAAAVIRRSAGLVCVALLLPGARARSQTPPAPGRTADAIVTLAPDVVARAGIQTATARTGRVADGLLVPAVVQPNAYRQVTLLSTAAGRVQAVSAELGQRVGRGDVLVKIHSPDVAEAEREYVGKRADLAYLRQQIGRLERLVAIGAASQQELDATRAQQIGLSADLEGVRSRLLLLGRTAAEIQALAGPAAISPVVALSAPLAGTITMRSANPGQTVDASAPLLAIVDLDSVWVVGDVYERDLAHVRVGGQATIGGAALGGAVLAGRVAYIDPQMAPESRTARVRVEVANPGGRLRLGMLLEMRLSEVTSDIVLVPKTAIQTIGGVSVVYVADPRTPGTFIERSVRLGAASGDDVPVLAGLTAGEAVVTTGSFFVRAERDRASPAAPRPAPDPPAGGTGAGPAPQPAARATTIDIAITERGFTPPEVNVPPNTPVRLRFTRKVEATCATEVVLPALKITRALPLGTPVIVDLPPQPAGRLAFACGMDMYKGTVIVR